jgi:hypothetical protein
MTTYSTSLKLTLIGDGQESGTWGQTTNTNLGSLLEQAITGYVAINMADSNVTLTNLNGTLDQARNAVIELTGTNSAVRDVIPPVVEKLYTIFNNTTGGFAVRVIGATGTGVNIPSGSTCLVYCNGTNFINGLSGVSSNFTVAGTITATSTITSAAGISATTGTFSGAITSASPTFTGTVTIPTPSPGSNTTIAASTAFVTNAVTTATGSLGTMSTQNANNVSITGGTITGITDLAVADGGTGRSSLTANNVVLGNGTSAVNFVAPSTSGNVLVSNGTTWTSATLATSGIKLGLGITGEVWNDLTGSKAFNTSYTNNLAYPIAVTARTNCSGGSAINFIVDGVSISNFNWQFNGCGSFGGGFVIVPPGKTYQLDSGQSLNFWRELY